MILATKSGWLILVRVLRKTRSGHHVQPVDSTSPFFVSFKDTRRAVFANVDAAMEFCSPQNAGAG